MKRRTVKVELTEAQMNALRAAVDNHGLFLMDNYEGSRYLRAQLKSLNAAWGKLEGAWYRQSDAR